MDKKKDDQYYLEKIKTDLVFIINHTQGKTQREIEENELLIDSILFRIIQISENSIKLSEQFKEKNKNVPWIAIKGMRNRIVHDYGYIDLEIVHDTVIRGIPKMYEELKDIQV